ncbi:MAG: hypothetical protein A3C53_08240 [Omnitrophica WOR_2 bacterium RIFCSPHIGHO2_02_FULL_68_15]|nr:MAG: hypothetical protein A3C53_08240 [Omnitrophica WOR_2 bacterium RIFCSPHIGHO2_02_FULL_68_15]
MQRFIYTRHALKRLKQRELTVDHIRATVRYPDRRRPGKLPNTVKYWKEIEGQTCFVVVELRGEQVIVITVGWKEGHP